MNKLEVGMYCKTKDGIITKVDDIDDETIYFDKDIYRFYGDGIDFLEKNNLERIIKASFDIIDILKKGDYVNGEEVFEVIIDGKMSRVKTTSCSTYFIDQIESVVTKEQFESMSYRIGE